MTLTIGLTGGIGSGKSTVAQLFQEKGIAVYDTDAIARKLTERDSVTLSEIVAEFGQEILDASGNLDRNTLKQKVFSHDHARSKLESILHPKIRKILMTNIAACQTPYCIAVIPLLIEKHWQDVVDRVLVVDLPPELQLTRATDRDKIPESLVLKIMSSQLDRNTRLGHADDIIDNSGGLVDLARQVDQLDSNYLALASSR